MGWFPQAPSPGCRLGSLERLAGWGGLPSTLCSLHPALHPARPAQGHHLQLLPEAPTEVPSASLQGLCESQKDQKAKALSKTYFFLNGIYCFCLLTTNTVRHGAKVLENTKEAKEKNISSHSTTKEQPLLTEMSHLCLLIPQEQAQ